jgi:hypothetical protein
MKAWGVAFGLIGLLAVGGCGSSGGGQSALDTLLFAATTPPPIETPAPDDAFCPPVTVAEGGAAIRSGGPDAVRSQIALGQLARECAARPDGSTVVKVGAEGRVLLGVGGSAGRFDVPLRIQVKQGGTVLANRLRRTSVTIAKGETQAVFRVVEEGIVVPASAAQDFTIEVALATR